MMTNSVNFHKLSYLCLDSGAKILERRSGSLQKLASWLS